VIRRAALLALRIRQSPSVTRLRMALAGLRLLASGATIPRAVGRALIATALDRVPPDEREWAARIESRRRELSGRRTVAEPVFDPRPPDSPGFCWPIYQPVSVDAAAQAMSLPALWCVLLMRLVRELAPRSCLELGTAFGISGAYQAAALQLNGGGRLATLEGAGEWAEIAQEGFASLELGGSVELLVGPISETFPDAARSGPFEFAFIDAEHTREALLDYLDTMLPHLTGGAVLVFDDIWLATDMRRAWRTITRHDRVETSVGIGRVGIAVVVSAP
jgi:predicted O-methyltransferase YrrM